MNNKQDFTERLLKWNKNKNNRSMPWKGEKDPYKIWVSEIILQQTRVEQGLIYYEKFIGKFPTIYHLTRAKEKKIFKLWEGLGYYSRCKNMIETAKRIVKRYNGTFPSSYDEIIKLKGIGPYTASAIASFAFNLPYAVVDGNVERVLARYFGIKKPTDTTEGKKFYAALAQTLLDKKQPGIYNQAIMDFGATVCKPQNPICSDCSLRKKCVSFKKRWTGILPVKTKSIERKNRWFYYFVVETNEGGVYIGKRTNEDIWKNLYEFVLWETGRSITAKKIQLSDFLDQFFKGTKFTIKEVSEIYKQQLTHQTIQGQFIQVLVYPPFPALKEYILIKKNKLKDYPLPKLINAYLQNQV